MTTIAIWTVTSAVRSRESAKDPLATTLARMVRSATNVTFAIRSATGDALRYYMYTQSMRFKSFLIRHL